MITSCVTWPLKDLGIYLVMKSCIEVLLWLTENGFATASASVSVTASSCAECLVGDGNVLLLCFVFLSTFHIQIAVAKGRVDGIV